MMAPDDFSVGAWVTVLDWKPREVETFGMGGIFGVSTDTRIYQDTSFVGYVLRIEAVDLPFVVVTVHGDKLFGNRPRRIDTRQCTLKRLSDAYVAAALACPPTT